MSLKYFLPATNNYYFYYGLYAVGAFLPKRPVKLKYSSPVAKPTSQYLLRLVVFFFSHLILNSCIVDLILFCNL